jgi:hypothetical protein
MLFTKSAAKNQGRTRDWRKRRTTDPAFQNKVFDLYNTLAIFYTEPGLIKIFLRAKRIPKPKS